MTDTIEAPSPERTWVWKILGMPNAESPKLSPLLRAALVTMDLSAALDAFSSACADFDRAFEHRMGYPVALGSYSAVSGWSPLAAELSKVRTASAAALNALSQAAAQRDPSTATTAEETAKQIVAERDSRAAAIQQCLLISDQLEASTAAFKSFKTSLLWSPAIRLRRQLPGTALILCGFLLLWALWSKQSSLISADLSEHLGLAAANASQSAADIADARVVLDSLQPHSTPLALARSGGKPPTAALKADYALTADRQGEVRAFLTAANTNSATALDALNRAQALAHEHRTMSATELTRNVSRAIGLSEAVKAAAMRFADVQFEGDKAVPKERATWLAAASVYAAALGLETKALIQGATAADSASRIQSLSKVAASGASTAASGKKGPVPAAVAASSPSSESMYAAAMEGRGGVGFVIRITFATAYLLIGAGVLYLLGSLFGLIDPKATITRLIDEATAEKPSLWGKVWPLLAPLGLAAGLAAGAALAPTGVDKKAPPESPHVKPAATSSTQLMPDSTALTKMLKMVTNIDTLTDSMYLETKGLKKRAN